MAGDFDNDGWDDIALVWNDGGLIDIDVHSNNHAGGFNWQRWQTGQGAWIEGCQVLAGNFDGSGGADIAYVYPWAWTSSGGASQGSVDLHRATPAPPWVTGQPEPHGGFTPPVTWAGYIPWGQAMVADIDGNHLSDVIIASRSVPSTDSGDIDITSFRSTGRGFTMVFDANQQGLWPQYVGFLAADFDGDGLADVADPFEVSGGIYIDVHHH